MISYAEFEAIMEEILSEECREKDILTNKIGQKLSLEVLLKQEEQGQRTTTL